MCPNPDNIEEDIHIDTHKRGAYYKMVILDGNIEHYANSVLNGERIAISFQLPYMSFEDA